MTIENLDQMLQQAFDAGEDVDTIYLLSDGTPTVGQHVVQERIVALAEPLGLGADGVVAQLVVLGRARDVLAHRLQRDGDHPNWASTSSVRRYSTRP